MLVTVFTPTFNRAHTLDRLFQSLLRQTRQDFEWLIVDDGSTDQTAAMIKDMAAQAPFPVVLARQANGGKHRAINHGLHLAKGELFFIVDSDDDLTEDAIEQIQAHWQNVGADAGCAGLCLRKLNRQTKVVIGRPLPQPVIDSNHIDMAAKYGVRGDRAEVFRTSVLRELPFPEIPGETFFPEAFIWEQASERAFMRYVDRVIYNCEYLAEGYSCNFKQNLRRNPAGFLLYYRTVLLDRRRPLLTRLRALIRTIQCFARAK